MYKLYVEWRGVCFIAAELGVSVFCFQGFVFFMVENLEDLFSRCCISDGRGDLCLLLSFDLFYIRFVILSG